MTPPVLNDVTELGLVQVRDRLLGVEGQQGGVRGVDDQGGEVGDVVNTKYQDVDDQQGQLGCAVDGGDEGEEDVDGEGEEEDPGHDLLGMKGKLKAVDPPPFSEFLHCRVTCWLWHNSGYSMIPLYNSLSGGKNRTVLYLVQVSKGQETNMTIILILRCRQERKVHGGPWRYKSKGSYDYYCLIDFLIHCCAVVECQWIT